MSPPRDQDGGWAWVVLGACSVCVMVTSGMAIVAGMFQTVFLDNWGGGLILTTWITSLYSSLMQLAGPVSGVVCTVFGCRVSVMSGAVLLTAGLVMSALGSNLTTLFCGFGLSSGLGLGLIYSPAIVQVNQSFVRLRSLATGTVLAAGGVGVMLMPVVCRYLLSSQSPSFTLLLLAGVSAQLIVAGALLYSGAGNTAANTGTSLSSSSLSSSTSVSSSALKKWCFCCFCLCCSSFGRPNFPRSSRPKKRAVYAAGETDVTSHEASSLLPTAGLGEASTAEVLTLSVSAALPRVSSPCSAVGEAVPNGIGTRTNGTDTRTDDTDTRTDSRTDGTDTKTVGTDNKTVGTDTKTVGTDTRTDDTDTRTDGTDTRTVDTDTRTDGTDTRTDGTDTMESNISKDTLFPSGDGARCDIATTDREESAVLLTMPRQRDSAAWKKEEKEKEEEEEEKEEAENLEATPVPAITLMQNVRRVLTSPSILILCLQLFLSSAAVGIVFVHFVTFCVQMGSSFDDVSLAFSANGLCLTVSRFMVGALGQDLSLDPLSVYVGMALVTSLIMVLTPVLALSVAMQIGTMAGLGVYCGSSYVLITEITIHCAGLDTLSLAFGLEMVSAGLGYLVAPPLAGWLVVWTNSYRNAIFLAGCLYLISAFVAMTLSLTRPKWTPGQSSFQKDVTPAGDRIIST